MDSNTLPSSDSKMESLTYLADCTSGSEDNSVGDNTVGEVPPLTDPDSSDSEDNLDFEGKW